MNIIATRCRRLSNYAVVALILAAAPLAAQMWPPQYAATRAQQAWLSYAEVHNVFDRVSVSYLVGEFDVRRTSTSVARPSLLPSRGVGALYTGSSGQGLDVELARELRTNSFRYSTGDTLRFHRAITVRVPCIDAGGSSSDNGSAAPSGADQARMVEDARLALFYVPTDSAVTDTMRVQIALVDAQSNAVLAVLDSLFTGPTAGSRIYEPRGTEPLRMNRSVQLPTAYAQRDVCLAVLPHRNGPSTHGFGLSFTTSHYTRSALREYASVGEYTAERTEELRVVERGYVRALIDHYDRIVAEEGCVRYLETSIAIDDPELRLSFAKRYHDDVKYDADGMLEYRMRQCGVAAKTSLELPVVGPAEVTVRGALTSLERNVDVRLHAPLIQATLAIYEATTGKLILEMPVCRNGMQEDSLPIRLPSSGAYIARLSDVLGQLVRIQFAVHQ